MITKAIIKKLPSGAYTEDGKIVYNNKFDIFVPIFLNAGENTNSKSCAANMKATLCYEPGNVNNYKVGDAVFIAFEDNRMSKPVIIGKLYKGYEDTDTNLSTNDVLKVSSQASLPSNTTIGDISGEDLAKLFRLVYNIPLKNYVVEVYCDTFSLPIKTIHSLPSDLPLSTINSMLNFDLDALDLKTAEEQQQILELWYNMYNLLNYIDVSIMNTYFSVSKYSDNVKYEYYSAPATLGFTVTITHTSLGYDYFSVNRSKPFRLIIREQ